MERRQNEDLPEPQEDEKKQVGDDLNNYPIPQDSETEKKQLVDYQ